MSLNLLIEGLEEAFERKAWHGPNLRGALRGVTFQQAAWRPGPERHNIWEIAVHAAYWKYAVRRRISGEKRGSFPEKGSNWFDRPEKESEQAWRRDVRLLVEQHRLLVDVVSGMSENQLLRKMEKSRYTYAETIRGIAYHDVYHAGQIQLLKRLEKNR